MYWLYAASLLSVLTLVIHVTAGGRAVARPLLESELGPEAKYTNYYCWHLVTIVIAACFALPASQAAAIDLARLATVLAAAFAAWSGLLAILKRQNALTLPQWMLFLPIAVCGAAGSF
ncbi:MAG: hypothetical protein KTR15_12045 [Phycisphaeraceae bacterium]|nr:hypothetical protein [Phycisphaeraceae bacterium]